MGPLFSPRVDVYVWCVQNARFQIGPALPPQTKTRAPVIALGRIRELGKDFCFYFDFDTQDLRANFNNLDEKGLGSHVVAFACMYTHIKTCL